MATNFRSGTGRILFGDPFKPSPIIDDVTKKPKLDPTTGQPMIEYIVGVGFPKGDPEFNRLYGELKAEDRAAWPQFHGADGNTLPGVVFADKITDGDGFDKKGQPRNRRDGYGGHWVVKFASRYAPTCYRWENNAWAQITDGIQPGDYVQIGGSTQSNQSQQSPGMYRNLNMVALVGKGAPIVRGADPNDVFGNAPPPLPPGATHTPQAPAAPMPAGPQSSAPGVVLPPGAVTPPLTPVTPSAAPTTDGLTMTSPSSPAPATAAPPYTGYMAGGPPPAPPAPAAPAAPVRVMLPAAQGATYEAMIAAGWTDALLVAHGMMQG